MCFKYSVSYVQWVVSSVLYVRWGCMYSVFLVQCVIGTVGSM